MKYNKGEEEEKVHKKVGMMMEMPKMKPTVYFSVEDLPALKNWKVGGKYTVIMKLKQTSMSMDEMGHRGSFEIEKVEAKE